MTFSKLPKLNLTHISTENLPVDAPPMQRDAECQNGPSPEVKLEKACRPCRRKRQGAAAVEFAIVAPLFFLMVFGMIELGRAIMVKQILTNASREGAREGVVDGATSAAVISDVTSYLQKTGITGATVTVLNQNGAAVEPATLGYGEPLTVKVSVPFSNVSWLPAPAFIGLNTNLTATTVMRRETVQ